MTRRNQYLCASAAGVIGMLLIAPAYADNSVETVVVTAQKRPENNQKVPISVTALAASTMEARGVTDVQDLSTVAPGLDFSQQLASGTPFLRGVGSPNTTVGEEPVVAVYVDGVYRPSLPGALFNFNNIDHVEVLSGPQGTLFGRNAVGGVVNVITKDPSQTPSADIRIGFGSYDTAEGSFYGTTGVTDNLAADLAVYWTDQGEGFLKNLYDGKRVGTEKDLNLRSKWVWDVDSKTQVKLSADYDDYHSPTGLWANAVGSKNFYTVDEDFPGGAYAKQYGLGLTVTHDFDWMTLVSISSFRHVKSFLSLDFDLTPLPLLNITVTNPETTYTQELQIVSPENSKIKWIAGFFYFNNRSGEDPNYESGIVIPLPYLNGFAVEKAESYAGYAQATVPLWWETNLTLGYRFTDDQRSIFGYSFTSPAIFPPKGILPGTEGQQSASFTNSTYRVSLDHQISEDVMAYASFNTGFKSGLFNAEAPTLPPVQPESVYAYEVGEKAQFFDDRLQFNSAAFIYNVQHIQVQIVRNGVVYLLNAAGADVKGVEAEMEAVPVDNLDIQAAVSYLDATYSNFGSPTDPTCPTNTGPSPFIDCTNNALPHAPKWTFNAGIQYAIPSNIGAFQLSASALYNAGFFWDPDNVVRQPSYTMLNAAATWTSPDGRYDLRIWGKNLASAKYYAFATSQPFGAEGSPAFPLTFGISAGVHL